MRYYAAKYDNYANMLSRFAKHIGADFTNNRIVYPDFLGKGFVQAMVLPNGLDIAYFDYEMHTSVSFKREKTEKEYYILWICDCKGDTGLQFKVGTEKFIPLCQCAITALLSSHKDFSYIRNKGMAGRGISISLDSDWIKKFAGLGNNSNPLNKYFRKDFNSFDKIGLDPESRRLLKEIVHLEIDTPFKIYALQTRVMLLIERFFSNLIEKMSESYRKFNMTTSDIRRIIEAENMLVGDFSKKAPSISELSRRAGMSETKFKNNFKEVFELPVYQYYQTRRMESAKERILVDSKCISCVSREYGFASISNFTAAFKKKFNYLPSNLKNKSEAAITGNS